MGGIDGPASEDRLHKTGDFPVEPRACAGEFVFGHGVVQVQGIGGLTVNVFCNQANVSVRIPRATREAGHYCTANGGAFGRGHFFEDRSNGGFDARGNAVAGAGEFARITLLESGRFAGAKGFDHGTGLVLRVTQASTMLLLEPLVRTRVLRDGFTDLQVRPPGFLVNDAG